MILFLLGILSIVGPFSVDLYLAAFPVIAKDLNTTTAMISLTLSSYFVGIAVGQLLYGPLLDRFGRKPPLFAGMMIFLLATIGCGQAHDVHTLIILRFIQAIGGCVAQVASVAMVRDFYSVDKGARVFSLLFLFIGTSPLFAPTIGSFIVETNHWRWIFYDLAIGVAVIITLIGIFLPEPRGANPSISLKFSPIIREYVAVMKEPQFAMYALSGAFAFSGLFAYVAGSPIVFMEGFGVSTREYGYIFAGLTMGFVGGNQANLFLLKKWKSPQIFRMALMIQVVIGLLFVISAWMNILDLQRTMVFFFVFLACAGITFPNAASLSMAPFSENAGSASALMGFLQMGAGALVSFSIGLFPASGSLPVIIVLALTAMIGFSLLLLGQRATSKR